MILRLDPFIQGGDCPLFSLSEMQNNYKEATSKRSELINETGRSRCYSEIKTPGVPGAKEVRQDGDV